MRKSRLLLIAGAAAAVIAAGLWQFVLRGQIDYARIAVAYGAKKVCSCRNVAGLPMATCLQDFTQDIGMVKFTEASEGGAPAVKASVLFGTISDRAVYHPGMGCRLEP